MITTFSLWRYDQVLLGPLIKSHALLDLFQQSLLLRLFELWVYDLDELERREIVTALAVKWWLEAFD
jgi:hypothetical protein